MAQARSNRQTTTHQTQSTNRQQNQKKKNTKKNTIKTQTQTSVTSAPATQTTITQPTKTTTTTDYVDSHHVNKALVVMGACFCRPYLRLFLRSLSIKPTTARISRRACSPRKERTCPADLKMKLTIEPMSPGRSDPNF